MWESDNNARKRVDEIFSDSTQRMAKSFLEDFYNTPVSSVEQGVRNNAAESLIDLLSDIKLEDFFK